MSDLGRVDEFANKRWTTREIDREARRACPRCGGSVRTAFFNASITGHQTLLYHYFRLLACEARFCAPNVWSCDACKIAGPITDYRGDPAPGAGHAESQT